jgi:uncharacterized protein YjbI with pentapeptide repeats
MAGPGTNTTDATPYPIWGFDPPSPEPDTKKLDALLASLNGSAERFQTLWFSFLGLTLYLAIAALATTHRDLLLNNPQTLPILNIKVELLPFYVIAPLLYLVFHFYLLMMLALLARTAAEFDKQLRTALPGEPERERYRAQVGNALFLQLLVGMKGERTGVNALLMGLIALITIVLAPLATLVLMQMMFLPYHHLRITWWHRAIVVADLVLIVVMTYRCFFPRGLRKAPLVLGALSRKPRWATAMAFCVLLAVALAPLVDWLSFRQGHWAGEPWPSSIAEWQRWMAGRPAPFADVDPDYQATKNGVVFGWFPNRLKLANQTIVGKEKLEKTKEEIASRDGGFVPTIELDFRDLQAADLNGADLRGVSLNYAAIQGAVLFFARLDGARLEGARLRSANLARAQLQGGDLSGAELQGAFLGMAQLQGADLRRAQLQGADLTSAQLQGANLEAAQLQGADLTSAQLQGANLGSGWQWQWQWQDAMFSPDLGQAAALGVGAQLQGADLTRAQMRGANLRGAQVQGVDFGGADLADTDLDGAFVFRANFGVGTIAPAKLENAEIRSVHAAQVKPGEGGTEVEQQLSDTQVAAWSDAATQFAAEENKKAIKERFFRLKPGFRTAEQDAADKARWSELAMLSLASDPDGAHHRERLAAFLSNLACDVDGAPYVARALVGQPDNGTVGRLAVLGVLLKSARTRINEGRRAGEPKRSIESLVLKDADPCPGVAGFMAEDWRRLDAIKPN